MNRRLDEAAERVDEDNPALTRALLRRARPASEVLPGLIGAKAAAELLSRRPSRPAAAPQLVARTFRLPPEVVDAYEATGADWRQLVARTLKEHMPGRK